MLTRLRSAARREDGLALPLAMWVLVVLLALSAAVAGGAIVGARRATHDRESKRAFGAADAGLTAALYRMNRYSQSPAGQAAPIDGASPSCFNDTAVSCASATPSAASGVGPGASFVYWVGPPLAQGDPCAGVRVVPNPSQTLYQRCVISVGTANGVTRRLQARVVALHGMPFFAFAGIAAFDSVSLNNRSTILGDLACNCDDGFGNYRGGNTVDIQQSEIDGQLRLVSLNGRTPWPTTWVSNLTGTSCSGNPPYQWCLKSTGGITSWCCTPAPYSGTLGNADSQAGTYQCCPVAIDRIGAQPIPFPTTTPPATQTAFCGQAGVTCSGSNINYTGSTPSTCSALQTASGLKYCLSIGNASTVTLPPGDYYFCSILVNNNGTLQTTPDANKTTPVRIYLDSPLRPGSQCGGQGAAQTDDLDPAADVPTVLPWAVNPSGSGAAGVLDDGIHNTTGGPAPNTSSDYISTDTAGATTEVAFAPTRTYSSVNSVTLNAYVETSATSGATITLYRRNFDDTLTTLATATVPPNSPAGWFSATCNTAPCTSFTNADIDHLEALFTATGSGTSQVFAAFAHIAGVGSPSEGSMQSTNGGALINQTSTSPREAAGLEVFVGGTAPVKLLNGTCTSYYLVYAPNSSVQLIGNNTATDRNGVGCPGGRISTQGAMLARTLTFNNRVAMSWDGTALDEVTGSGTTYVQQAFRECKPATGSTDVTTAC
jgi:Tfp pilus assembly protein PilX